jgi:cytidylate kinase
VCVSHTTGSGGDEVGKQVAGRLGYLYVDEDIVARAAAVGGLDPGEIADEERRKSYVGRLLDTLAQGGGDAWTLGTTAAVEVVRPEDVRALIRETVAQTAARGRVVIVAHAASHLLDPGPHMLRVFVTASPATRQK